MISKTLISKRVGRKSNKELAEAIILAKKQDQIKLAQVLSGPTRNQAKVNVSEIQESGKDSVIVPGKVLAKGDIDRKTAVYALSFSAAAKEKLSKAGCETKTIISALREGKLSGELLR